MIRLEIVPHDPVIARDGRPFGSGQCHRMRCLEWLYPSVLAGSFRTLLGKKSGGNFDVETVGKLKTLGISGPLLMYDGKLYFPAPKDIVIDENSRCFAKKPIVPGEKEHCDLPGESLLPTMLLDPPEDDFKPGEIPPFWSLENVCRWLADQTGTSFQFPENPGPETGFLGTLEHELRIHVQICPEMGAVDPDKGLLFMTDGLAFPADTAITALIQDHDSFAELIQDLDTLHPLGGERRLARWKTTIIGDWGCPSAIQELMGKGPKRIRMVLATPGIFSRGWRPGWLDDSFCGRIPGTGLEVRLTGACIERWKPVSGWGLEKGSVGPKPVRRMAPAGSVYFFEVLHGSASCLPNVWLKSVCDEIQDRKDGFGLALWGVWNNNTGGELEE
jgi:CRISPR-associated protein Cmr3